MINAKTILGLVLLIISGVEFLSIKDLYHLGEFNRALLLIEVIFLITVSMAVFLMVKGLRRHGNGNW
jgi:hypothetical protein